MTQGRIILLKDGWYFKSAKQNNALENILPVHPDDVDLAEKINALDLNHMAEAHVVYLNSDKAANPVFKIMNAEDLLK
jgi:hypothetical protein